MYFLLFLSYNTQNHKHTTDTILQKLILVNTTIDMHITQNIFGDFKNDRNYGKFSILNLRYPIANSSMLVLPMMIPPAS